MRGLEVLHAGACGYRVVLGTLTTNTVGIGTIHANTALTPGLHSVAIDVTLQGSPNDVLVTPGLYGLNLFMTFK